MKGCEVSGNGRDGFFFCWRVRDALVEGNVFRDNASVGISIGHKDSDNVIRGNTITSNDGGGVYWRRETNPMAGHRNLVVGNAVTDNGKFQLFIDGETEGTIIRKNQIKSGDAEAPAIRIGAKAGEVTVGENDVVAEVKLDDQRVE